MNKNMDIDEENIKNSNENKDILSKKNDFKSLYIKISESLYDLMMNMIIFDENFIFNEQNIIQYICMDSIMYLSNDILYYFVYGKKELYNKGCNIVKNQMLTDDSDYDDTNMNIHYQILIYIIDNYQKYIGVNELKDKLINISKYYILFFFENKDLYEMLKLELMMEYMKI